MLDTAVINMLKYTIIKISLKVRIKNGYLFQ